jgi:carnitine O-palmitoyltransferase 1, liver isoform
VVGVYALQNKERLDMLRKAGERHQQSYRATMCGQGVDRHLFALYIVSRYLELDSPFLKAVIFEPWRLSTSQVESE